MGDSNFINMYTTCLELTITKEINNNPDVASILGDKKADFIKWCAQQRVVYEADLKDEINEFLLIPTPRFPSRQWESVRQFVFERDNYTCVYCKSSALSLEVDHVIPVSRGGSNHISNLATSCRECNRSKHNKTGFEFTTWRLSNAK